MNNQQKLVSLFTLSLLVLSILLPYIPGESSTSLQHSARGSEEGIWEMFRCNPEHTGRTPYSTTDNPGKMQWKFRTGGSVRSSPAIGPDGTIYIGSDDGYIYAINPNGVLKWKFRTEGAVRSSPAIGPDGTIYIGSDDGNIYAINPNGTLKWRFETGGPIWSSPVISDEGTLYTGSDDDNLYAINPNGTLKWSFTTNDTLRSSPAIDKNGDIVFGSDGLYALNPNGSLFWKLSTDTSIQSSPAIAVDGVIYVGGSRYLYAVNPDGALRWRFPTDDLITSSPAISARGTVYIGSRDGKVYAIDPAGGLKWSYDTGSSIWWSSPAISAEGTVYVGTYGGKMCALTQNGSPRWIFDAGDAIWSSPAIGMNGAVYFGSSDSFVYSLWKSVPSPPENLRATTGDGYVNLSWEAPKDDGGSPIVEYRIYRGKAGSEEIYLYSVLPSENRYRDAIQNGMQYYYYITAVNDIGESEKSNEARTYTAAPPFPPENVRVKLDNGRVILSWDPPKEDGGAPIIEYRIYRGKEKGSENYLASVNGSTTKYVDSSVESGTYYYTVKAVNEAGESNFGERVRVNVERQGVPMSVILIAIAIVIFLLFLIIKKRKWLSILSKR